VAADGTGSGLCLLRDLRRKASGAAGEAIHVWQIFSPAHEVERSEGFPHHALARSKSEDGLALRHTRAIRHRPTLERSRNDRAHLFAGPIADIDVTYHCARIHDIAGLEALANNATGR